MLVYKQANLDIELKQIIALQKENLPRNLTNEEKTKEGFLTVEHSLELLKEMNAVCKHTIVLENGKVVGYALSMHPKFAQEITVLKPMFQEIKKVMPTDTDYMIMGQICIARTHRGKGVFRKLYETMKTLMPKNFTKIITEIATKNTRSINAHKAIGFKELKHYWASDKEWSLIVL